ncbi:MAG: helix-turn-helix transcriptional regulator [Mesorhizobium sp.]|uniref:helix-turn-helix domain-containing protein n=1 Tax=unclassified Mesorhizobium TaxID=325217 RepID=UPI000F75A117|nr:MULTISPECIES: helix-turn-helix transcriptional regulator [unclassified Mesorhizobium]AZO71368.1 XRE family transcriptional regulator [Mesorhizobium sp. M1D.F.Ca.ET.043.01.1.1]RWA94455.1 MAG: helix-turn-helix domain-containing protein [Mesorhizobium sp.]RWD66872.1 MAG: helix-turn-helix domain-containing protein [Mesorhizobium sp.]RWE40105.1 MAG: helix-turn-helix domain-containing protein [Mesorhizobium sp.]TIV73446.1 MAG: helix-turn-helix transcriptional regulator [Mesorhizobium sp.]
MASRDQLSAEQLRAARALLNWSRVRLAAKANLSESTICEFENGSSRPKPSNVAAMRRALEEAGIVFSEGSPSLARSEGQNGGRQTDNRRWRRRQTKGAPT